MTMHQLKSYIYPQKLFVRQRAHLHQKLYDHAFMIYKYTDNEYGHEKFWAVNLWLALFWQPITVAISAQHCSMLYWPFLDIQCIKKAIGILLLRWQDCMGFFSLGVCRCIIQIFGAYSRSSMNNHCILNLGYCVSYITTSKCFFIIIQLDHTEGNSSSYINMRQTLSF
jgi:hypothetical protein